MCTYSTLYILACTCTVNNAVVVYMYIRVVLPEHGVG